MQNITKNLRDTRSRIVVILEDDKKIADSVKECLGVFGFEPCHVDDPKEVLRMVSEQAGLSFILDVEIKGMRVGLDILEEIKTIQPQAFVCIYSTYIKEERLRHRAEKLNADFILNKTTLEKRDIYKIALGLLEHEEKLISLVKELVLLEFNSFESEAPLISGENDSPMVLGTDDKRNVLGAPRPRLQQDADPNVIQYEKLSSEQSWVKENAGKYVGIVRGALQIIHKDPVVVLAELRKLYPADRRFIKLVTTDDDDTIEMPSPMFVE